MSDTTEMSLADIQAAAKARMVLVREEIDALKAATADKRALLDQLNAQSAMLTARINALADEIHAAHGQRLLDLKKELGKLARMAGGY